MTTQIIHVGLQDGLKNLIALSSGLDTVAQCLMSSFSKTRIVALEVGHLQSRVYRESGQLALSSRDAFYAIDH